jgi:anaerobic selenocysteine-containing dehydrogenase
LQQGGSWERATWDQGLALLAEKIRHYRDEIDPFSIMHYQRTGSCGATKLLSRRFWNLLGGVIVSSGSLCSGAARAGQALDFGTRLGHDPMDVVNARLVLLWGRNPLATNLHLVPPLKEETRGAQLIIIDPVRAKATSRQQKHRGAIRLSHSRGLPAISEPSPRRSANCW